MGKVLAIAAAALLLSACSSNVTPVPGTGPGMYRVDKALLGCRDRDDTRTITDLLVAGQKDQATTLFERQMLSGQCVVFEKGETIRVVAPRPDHEIYTLIARASGQEQYWTLGRGNGL